MIKRLLLMMAAVASVTAAIPAASALARDDDRGGQRSQGQDRGQGRRYDGDRGGGRQYGGRERQYDRPRAGPERRFEEDRRRPQPRDDDRRVRVPALGYGDEPRGRRYDDERPRYEPRPRYEGRPRDDERPRYGYGDRPLRAQGFTAPPSARRGGYLPRNFSGEIVDDYRRYRLRTPPAGFAWVRMGRGFALVSMRDGQIFDMVQ